MEYAQITPQELSRGFDRVYEEIESLEDHMNARFDRVDERLDRLEEGVREIRTEIRELNRKFDIVMQYITGQSGAS